MRTITSRHNPLVARFRAAERVHRKERQYVLLDSPRLIDDACRAGIRPEVAIFSIGELRRSDRNLLKLAKRLESLGTEVMAASASVLSILSPVRAPSGAVALAPHKPIPFERVIEDNGIVLALMGVQNPGNLGAIIRAADAGSAAGVLVLDGSADPFSSKALRGAMGSTFHLPVADVTDGVAAIRRVHARSATVMAAVPRGGTSLYDVDLTKTRVILIGGEGSGLSSEIIDMVDDRISIPMKPNVESLNAAVAAGLIVYEARRQQMAVSRQQLSEHTS